MSCINPAAAGGRELRALLRRPRRRAGAAHDRAASLRGDGAQRVRLSAVVALRRDGRPGDLRPGLRPLGARVRLPGRGPHAGAVLRDARAPARETSRPRCASPAKARVPGRAGPAHRRVHGRGHRCARPRPCSASWPATAPWPPAWSWPRRASASTIRAASSIPNPTYLYANNWLQATYYQTMVTYLRELSGGGLLQVPSSYRDYLNPEIAADLERFVRSPGLKSVERVKLYKLAWDLVGSEFAGRHQQYELFYAGGAGADDLHPGLPRLRLRRGARHGRAVPRRATTCPPALRRGGSPATMTGAKARLVAELRRRQAELIELCAALVRIPSENPPGDTTRIAAFVVRYLRERGIRPVDPRAAQGHAQRRRQPRRGRAQPRAVRPPRRVSGRARDGRVPPFSGPGARRARFSGRGAGDMRGGAGRRALRRGPGPRGRPRRSRGRSRSPSPPTRRRAGRGARSGCSSTSRPCAAMPA